MYQHRSVSDKISVKIETDDPLRLKSHKVYKKFIFENIKIFCMQSIQIISKAI